MDDKRFDGLAWFAGLSIIFMSIAIIGLLGWGFIEIIQWITSK